MPLIVPEQRTPDWFVAHLNRITGSNAAACLGLDEYAGPLAAFNSITGKTTKPDNSNMQWGRENEARARSEYEIETGLVALETGFWVHPEIDWLGASPDGLVNLQGGLELKCPVKLENLPDHVSSSHEIQCRVNMMVTDRDWWDYFAWTPGKFYTERIHRDRETETYLIKRLEEFYERHIKPNVAPPRTAKARRAASASIGNSGP